MYLNINKENRNVSLLNIHGERQSNKEGKIYGRHSIYKAR